MLAALLVVQGLTLAALAALGVLYVRLRRRAAQLAAQVLQLVPAAGGAGPEAAAAAWPDKADLIAIEILNPMEVAAQESKLAVIFGGLTPGLVRREVYRQARDIIEQELRKRGVVGDVRVLRG